MGGNNIRDILSILFFIDEECYWKVVRMVAESEILHQSFQILSRKQNSLSAFKEVFEIDEKIFNELRRRI